jgi:hypothetical protein
MTCVLRTAYTYLEAALAHAGGGGARAAGRARPHHRQQRDGLDVSLVGARRQVSLRQATVLLHTASTQ